MGKSPESISRRSALGLTAASIGTAFCIGSVPEAAANACEDGLTDIGGHPFAEEVQTLVDSGIISGYPDCTFRPSDPITRGECAAMVADAFAIGGLADRPEFSDIDGHWAESQIRTAAGAGFFDGYPDGTFRPDADMRRVELVVALSSGLAYDGGAPDDLPTHYTDADEIPDWARQGVAEAHAVWNGIENPDSSAAFEPDRAATRAEAAKYVYDAMQAEDGDDDSEPAPTARFELDPQSPQTGETVSFDARTSTPGNAIQQYEWQFGDGTSATGQTATHTYTAANQYDVTLGVRTTDGQTDDRTQSIAVTAAPDDGGDGDGGGDGGDGSDGDDGDGSGPTPDARITVTPESPVAGDEVTVDAGTSTPGDEIEQYGWQFEDGTTVEGPTATRVYETAGDYEVALAVQTAGGQSDTETRTITVAANAGDGGSEGDDDEDGTEDGDTGGEDSGGDESGGGDDSDSEPSAPTARFNIEPVSPTATETVRFDASPSTPADDQILGYVWRFGDGTVARGQTATHVYDTAGSYDVTLALQTTDGSKDKETLSLTVTSPDAGGGSDETPPGRPIGGGNETDGGPDEPTPRPPIGGDDDAGNQEPPGRSDPGGGLFGPGTGSGSTDGTTEKRTPFGDSDDIGGGSDDDQGNGGTSLTIEDPAKIATGLLSGGVLTHVYRRFRRP